MVLQRCILCMGFGAGLRCADHSVIKLCISYILLFGIVPGVAPVANGQLFNCIAMHCAYCPWFCSVWCCAYCHEKASLYPFLPLYCCLGNVILCGGGVCVCVCARARVRACQPACVSVRACVRVCARACAVCHVFSMAKINKVAKTTE